MSKVRSDNISNRASDGAPKLVFGAEVPVGYGITGAGGINIAGVATAASFSGATGSFTGDVDIADKIIHTGDTNTAIRFPAADTFAVETAGSERLRVDSSGRTTAGGESATASGPQYSRLQVLGNTFAETTGLFSLRRNEVFGDITAGEDLGVIHFADRTGNTFAEIHGTCDGTTGSNDYPGRLAFYITADGASSATERLRITSAGEVQIANGNLKFSTAGKGIDFSATSDTGGMTSELLDDYEEGTWTPTWHGTLNSGTWAATGTYTKIGRTVTIQMAQTGGDVTFTVGGWIVGGLPFTPTNGQTGAAGDITDMSPSFGGIVSLQGSTRIYSAVAASNKTTLRINATFQV
jgi:hypothetical protein